MLYLIILCLIIWDFILILKIVTETGVQMLKKTNNYNLFIWSLFLWQSDLLSLLILELWYFMSATTFLGKIITTTVSYILPKDTKRKLITNYIFRFCLLLSCDLKTKKSKLQKVLWVRYLNFLLIIINN